MQQSNKETVVALDGEYDAARRDELDDLLDRHGDAEPLVFDLTRVERFDTAALRSLVRFQRAREQAGKAPFSLTNLQPRVRDFIRLAQLDGTLRVSDGA